ncbi:DUF4402 domain-containing protein [Piscirickettsia salmonis]|uniref:DUF4402 domain-containing protein n=1 Tax=Piscirickettsia salmonis TaxID=1238 RepID=UPI000F075C16|nr:hypothetical protein DA717_07180 [Piscirickettsiaceae bacterium NZ-RLO2]
MKKSSILSSLLLFALSPAFTFANANISLNTSTHIIAPITLEIEQLEFGTLIKPQSGRTHHEATALLEINGEKRQTVKINIPNRMNIINGSENLRVNLSIPTDQKRLNNQGKASVTITGSLRLAANTETGIYRGSTTITTSYL